MVMDQEDVSSDGKPIQTSDHDQHDSGCEQSPAALSPASSENKAKEIKSYSRVTIDLFKISDFVTYLIVIRFFRNFS